MLWRPPSLRVGAALCRLLGFNSPGSACNLQASQGQLAVAAHFAAQASAFPLRSCPCSGRTSGRPLGFAFSPALHARAFIILHPRRLRVKDPTHRVLPLNSPFSLPSLCYHCGELLSWHFPRPTVSISSCNSYSNKTSANPANSSSPASSSPWLSLRSFSISSTAPCPRSTPNRRTHHRTPASSPHLGISATCGIDFRIKTSRRQDQLNQIIATILCVSALSTPLPIFQFQIFIFDLLPARSPQSPKKRIRPRNILRNLRP